MVGGKHGRLGSRGDHRRRGPNRYALWVVLRENATGVLWLIEDFHGPAKIDTSAGWRLTLANQAIQGAAAEMTRAHKKHPTAHRVAVGDWNRKRAVNWRIGLVEARTPPTFGKLRYDRIQHDPDVRVSGTHEVNTPSDHNALVATLSAMGHATPAPIPPPTPTPEVPMPRQAHSLDVLLAEVNKLAPHRNKASDGGLGDAAHRSRISDHNPNAAGVWRARDFTDDSKGGCDADVLAQSVAAMLGKHPALGPGAYVIRNRRIISTNRLSEGWRPYTGTNPHIKHVHVSVATAAAGYDSTKAWGVRVTPEPEANHVQKGRAQIKEGLDLIDAGLKEIGKSDAGRKVTHQRAAGMAKSNAATRALYRKGPTS